MRTNLSSNAPWIPLQLTTNAHFIASDVIATIRGYNVNIHQSGDKIVTESVHICGDLLHDVQEVQFRWMATSKVDYGIVRNEMWALANVTANLVVESESIQIILFQDTFGSDTLK